MSLKFTNQKTFLEIAFYIKIDRHKNKYTIAAYHLKHQQNT